MFNRENEFRAEKGFFASSSIHWRHDADCAKQATNTDYPGKE
jgi:hypothetical protein